MDIHKRVAVCAACDLTARLRGELQRALQALLECDRRSALAPAGGEGRMLQDLLQLRLRIDGIEEALAELGCAHDEDRLQEDDDVAARVA